MTPSERPMPVTTATWDDLRRAWIVDLPGNLWKSARDEAEVEALRDRYASGSSISYRRGMPTRSGRA